MGKRVSRILKGELPGSADCRTHISKGSGREESRTGLEGGRSPIMVEQSQSRTRYK